MLLQQSTLLDDCHHQPTSQHCAFLLPVHPTCHGLSLCGHWIPFLCSSLCRKGMKTAPKHLPTCFWANFVGWEGYSLSIELPWASPDLACYRDEERVRQAPQMQYPWLPCLMGEGYNQPQIIPRAYTQAAFFRLWTVCWRSCSDILTVHRWETVLSSWGPGPNLLQHRHTVRNRDCGWPRSRQLGYGTYCHSINCSQNEKYFDHKVWYL